ncbi:HAD family hydrolase [Ktedonospora formicarum]|uniref:Hydrolase n=1 Tax=Ktedonospora formicarum TaxID=2778364 RepID=A0A8J3I8X1_9CHLR|nr:HAD family phosphatase [Ktedonospora formicarum]GHO49606.1 hydrolase [Ktedonospora formicarum]
MAIKAVVFDIGGILELTPPTGYGARWEAKLEHEPGELNRRLGDIWQAGSLGHCTLADVEQAIGERLGMDRPQVEAFMGDLWKEYLGELNVELADYFRSLRPSYRTAILSNSFVGAREREEELYHFSEMSEFIIYSHEVGLEKPDERIFALTCERLGLAPEEVIFLDDWGEAIKAAKAFGIHGVHFQTNAQAIAEINALLEI